MPIAEFFKKDNKWVIKDDKEQFIFSLASCNVPTEYIAESNNMDDEDFKKLSDDEKMKLFERFENEIFPTENFGKKILSRMENIGEINFEGVSGGAVGVHSSHKPDDLPNIENQELPNLARAVHATISKYYTYDELSDFNTEDKVQFNDFLNKMAQLGFDIYNENDLAKIQSLIGTYKKFIL